MAVIFLCLNTFLVVTPFVPPNGDWNSDGYPYYAYPLAGTAILLLGALYWLVWTRLWPEWTNLPITESLVVDEEGEDVPPPSKPLGHQGPSSASAEEQPLLRPKGNNRGQVYDSIGEMN